MVKQLNCLGIAENLKTSQRLEQDVKSRTPLTTREPVPGVKIVGSGAK